MKHKELFKTIVLSTLIVSSIYLSTKIWFYKELWSNDYNSFHYAIKSNDTIWSKFTSLFLKNTKNVSLDFNQIFYPKQILVNNDGKNALVTPDNSLFQYFNDAAKSYLNIFLKTGKFEEINEDSLKKAYKSASVYYDFYAPISFEMLSDYFGESIPDNNKDINNIKHLLISLNTDSNMVNMYVKNSISGKMYKLTLNAEHQEFISKSSEVTRKIGNSEKLYSYAFENSFDKFPENQDPNEQAIQKLLLDPFLLINISNVSSFQVKEEPILKNSDYSRLETLVTQFNIKPTTARRFVDKNQTINYVENFGTLKIHNDGLLEYDAVDYSKGIALNSTSASEYDIVINVGEFIGKVNGLFDSYDYNNIIFKSIIQDDVKNKYILTFDILLNGSPVIVNKELNNKDILKNTIQVVVENGRIVSYKQLLINYIKDSNSTKSTSLINALDEFYSQYDTSNNKNLIIQDIFSIYYNSSGTIESQWVVALSNGDMIIVNPKSSFGT